MMIVGLSGSGKSTFSRNLRDILLLPLYSLDNIWWKEDKSHITREEFDRILESIIEKDEWIIDGDYSRTYEVRMKAADTIFFLDFPLDFCLRSVESRVGTKREDIPWVEEEFDPEFKEWMIEWYYNTRPFLIELLKKYQNDKTIITFKNREEIALYLKALKEKN